MNNAQILRVGGSALFVGAVAFILYVVARSVITAGVDLATSAKEAVWVPVSAIGVIGAVLVLLGLPAMYSRIAGTAGLFGLAGVVMISLAWIFFGAFLTLFSLLLAPWLADRAPSVITGSASLPPALLIAFAVALLFQIVGSVLLAIPFMQARLQPRRVGFLLPVSSLLALLGNLAAPNGPSSSLVLNLLSNLGSVLLLVTLGDLGFRIASEKAPRDAP